MPWRARVWLEREGSCDEKMQEGWRREEEMEEGGKEDGNLYPCKELPWNGREPQGTNSYSGKIVSA